MAKRSSSASRSPASVSTSREQPAVTNGGSLLGLFVGDACESFRKVLLAACIALWVSTPFLPSEATLSDGTFAPHAMLWMLVALAYSGWLLLPPSAAEKQARKRLQFQTVEWLGAALVLWMVISSLQSWGVGNTRATLHGIWLMLGYAVGTIVTSRLIRSIAEARALLILLCGLALALAVHGLYQFGVTFPQVRAEFQTNPTQICRETGIDPDPQSVEHQLFRNRVESREPLATFSLTNSLAGLLGPSLILLVGLVSGWIRRRPMWQGIVPLAACGILGITLLLTKSRTAYLAVAMGLGLLAIGYSKLGQGLKWWSLVLVAAAGLGLAVAAVAAGGLDKEVLSEAPKSLLYRLEYWQSSSRMLADHLLWGIGLGNFQAQYAAYKLPQASEMIADPHNLWVELATSGGILAALLGLLFSISILRFAATASVTSQSTSSPVNSSSLRKLFGTGTLVGFVLGTLLALIMGYTLSARMLGGNVGLLLLGLPCMALLFFTLTSKLPPSADAEAGEASDELGWAMIVTLLVWGFNLLAAGALVFPGVMMVGCILIAVIRSVPFRPSENAGADSAVHLSPLPRWGLLAMELLGVLLCARTDYLPTLNARGLVAQAGQGLATGENQVAIEAVLKEAIQADPYHAEARQFMAQLQLWKWLRTPNDTNEEALETAVQDWNRVTAPSPGVYQQQAEWYLTCYRRQPSQKWLDKAREAADEVIRRYPAGALGYVQAAWLAHLAGEKETAAILAKRGLELDAMMPHQDQKLAKRRVFDMEFRQGGPVATKELPADKTATMLADPGEGPETK